MEMKGKQMSIESWNKDKKAVEMMRKTVEDYKGIFKSKTTNEMVDKENNRRCYFCEEANVIRIREKNRKDEDKAVCAYCKIVKHFDISCIDIFSKWWNYRDRDYDDADFDILKKGLKLAIEELEQYTGR